MAEEITGLALDFIERAQNYADTSVQRIFTQTADLLAQSNNVNNITFDNFSFISNFNSTWIGLVPPDPFTKADIPNPDLLLNQYVTQYQNDWLEKYRLIMGENFSNLFSFRLAENSLEDILQNGYLIQKSVRDQIVNRAIDEEYFLYRQNQDDILKDFSSKGWTIPNSNLLNRLDKNTYTFNNKISSINRDVAIKDQDLYTDMKKFAIQQSTDLLPKCVQIASDFVGKYSQVYNFGAENVRTYISGLNAVTDSIRNYHDIFIRRVQTSLNDVQNQRQADIDKKTKIAQFDLQKLSFEVDTNLRIVSALGSVANAALQANQSIVSLNSSTLTQSVQASS